MTQMSPPFAPRSYSKPPLSVHLRLNEFNHRRLAPGPHTPRWEEALAHEAEARLLECRFVESERSAIVALASRAPRDANAFVGWFEDLQDTGAGQAHPLFPWLAQTATIEQMTWFLSQEVAGEAGFDDLVALTQVKLPPQAKLELARNYWDEMGQGHASAMHGPMLTRLAQELQIENMGIEPVWETLALGNMMLALAMNRHYAFQSIGALGVIELTAPGRATLVNQGLKRLGIAGEARRYYGLHATLDVRHSVAWNREVIGSLVASDPERAQPIAEGALLRLAAGERCFNCYARELNAPPFERFDDVAGAVAPGFRA